MRTAHDAASVSDPVAFSYEGAPITIHLPTSNEHMGRALRTYRTFYERDVLEAIRDTLRRQPAPFAIVDVGAFCGNHTTYFAKFCGASRVIACEPTAASFAALTQTLAANGVASTVRACNTAIGDTTGRGTMLQGIADNSGGNTFAPGSGDTPVTTVDRLLEDELPAGMRVALIKIDVEGGEVAVLRGSRRTIETHRPRLCAELMTATQLRLALDALPTRVVQPFRLDEREGDVPVQQAVVGEVDALLAPLAEKFLDLVAAVAERNRDWFGKGLRCVSGYRRFIAWSWREG